MFEEMLKGSFFEVLDDLIVNKVSVDMVVFCFGKFYYELKVKVKEFGVENMVFVCMEQFYLFLQV